MNKKKVIEFLNRNKRILIGLLTIILILFMIFVVDFNQFINKILTIGLWGTILFILMYTIAFLFRALKLKMIYLGIEKPISFSTAYFTLGAAFVINDLTPGKFGDITKIFLIKDQENLRLSHSSAGIAIERILDLILLFGISCLAFFYLYFTNLHSSQTATVLGQSIQFYILMGALFIVAIFIGLIILFYKTEFFINVISKFSGKLADLIDRFIKNFKKGINKFKDNKKALAWIIFLGFPTWIIDGMIVSIFFYFTGYPLNLFILLLAILLSFFSKAFQITPGNWGISENVGALFIFFFYPHLPYFEVLSIFLIDHLFRSVYLLFFGGYSIFHYNFKLKELEETNYQNGENE